MNPYWLVAALGLLTQFFVFLRWVHRRLLDDEMRRAFVRDIGTNHLPHIYHALRLIAAQLDVEIDEPPPLRFTELGRPDKHDL
jgi:hypothetical protein